MSKNTDHVSSTKLRVERLSRRHQAFERQRPASLVTAQRINSVIHVSIRAPNSARRPVDTKDKERINNNSATLTTRQNRSRSEKSKSTRRSVSVTSVPRSLSHSRQNSWKSTVGSSQRSTGKPKQNQYGTISASKTHGLRTAKVAHHQDTDTNQSISSNHDTSRKSFGTLEDLMNPLHKQQHLTENKKKSFRCSKRYVIVPLCVIILLGIIITTILVVLLNKPKKTAEQPSTMAFLRWNTTGTTILGTTNIRGNTSSQLYSPFGLALDSFNMLYIADRYNDRIQKCRIGEGFCTTVAGHASPAPGNDTTDLRGPTYIYIDSNNNLYIADSGNQRVQLWTYGASYGNTVAGITGTHWDSLLFSSFFIIALNIELIINILIGSSGIALNQFAIPYGVVLDSSSGTMYVADYNNNRVMQYLSGAASGTVIAGGHGFGTNNTQLYNLAGLYFDSSTNSLIVANFGASNIVRWAIGDSKWTITAGDTNGLNGNTSTFLDHPTSVTFDPMGNMYVADMFNHRIQLFLVGQSNGTTIAGISGIFGQNSTMLYYPVSVILDSQLNLYVTDSFNQQIQTFVRY